MKKSASVKLNGTKKPLPRSDLFARTSKYYPFGNKNFRLEVADEGRRKQVAREVKALGGRVVGAVDERPLCGLICDHPTTRLIADLQQSTIRGRGGGAPAEALERIERKLNKLCEKTLLTVRQAVERNVRVREVTRFLEQIAAFKAKNVRPPPILGAPAKEPFPTRAERLGLQVADEPFLKLEDPRLCTRSYLAGMPAVNNNCFKIFINADSHVSLFQTPSAARSASSSASSPAEPKRVAEPTALAGVAEPNSPESVEDPNALDYELFVDWHTYESVGFCQICSERYDDERVHLDSQTHQRRIAADGFYDVVDAELANVLERPAGDDDES